LKDRVVKKSKSLAEKAKNMSPEQKKKAAAVVVGLWGGAAAIGWISGSSTPPSTAHVTNKKK